MHPYFSVYFNHTVTGIFSAVMAAVWLAVTRQNPFVVLRAYGFKSLCGAFWASTAFAVGLMYNILWSASLPLVSVAVFSAITQTTCMFVLVFAAIFLRRRVAWLEVASIVFCLGGVAIISFLGTDSPDSNTSAANASTVSPAVLAATAAVDVLLGATSATATNSPMGIALVVGFTMLQAGYLVVWGWRFSNEKGEFPPVETEHVDDAERVALAKAR